VCGHDANDDQPFHFSLGFGRSLFCGGACLFGFGSLGQ
jgi:hypothetical protein